MSINSTNNLFRNAAFVEQQLQEIDIIPEDVFSDISETSESEDFKKHVQSAKKTLVNREISVILRSAKDLENSLINNNLVHIAAKVDALKNSLQTFHSRHGNEYGFIQEAEAFIAVVEKHLGNPKKNTHELESAYFTFSQALEEKFEGRAPTTSEVVLIEELFDLARAIHHHQQGIENQLKRIKDQLGSKNLIAKIDRSLGNRAALSTTLLEVGHELAGKPFDGDVKGWFHAVDSFHEIPSFVYQNV